MKNKRKHRVDTFKYIQVKNIFPLLNKGPTLPFMNNLTQLSLLIVLTFLQQVLISTLQMRKVSDDKFLAQDHTYHHAVNHR